MPMTKREIDRMLKKPIVAVVAVTAPDGAPHAVPIWYEYRRGEVVFHTSQDTFKYKCLQHDPRITLCVDTKQSPYKCVILKGHATMEIKADDARIRRMAIAYLGKREGAAFANSLRGQKAVVVRFKPERVISWDYRKDPV